MQKKVEEHLRGQGGTVWDEASSVDLPHDGGHLSEDGGGGGRAVGSGGDKAAGAGERKARSVRSLVERRERSTS